jgi:hypothetical protein
MLSLYAFLLHFGGQSKLIYFNTDPLLMNAFNNVNLAGSCILTSAEYAKELGVPESRWIYPLGGAGTQDAANCMFTSTTWFSVF